MNKGIKIILERMETNPEEFGKGLWDSFFDPAWITDIFGEGTEETKTLLTCAEKIDFLKQEELKNTFTGHVVANLMNIDKRKQDENNNDRL
jgi:hypothetical protein